MSRRVAVFALVAAIAAGVVASAAGQQNVTLRYRWVPGEALAYRMTQESVVLISMPGMGDTTVTTSVVQVQRLTTESVADDGAATVQALFESIKMEVSSAAMRVAWDSAAPESASGPMSAEIGRVLGAMVGQSATMVIDSTGALRSIEGMDEIMKKVTEADPQVAAALGQLGNLEQVSDDGLSAMFAQGFGTFPAAAVAVGDTWPFELKMPNAFGEMTVSTVFRLAGFDTVDERRMARIALEQTIAAAPGTVGAMGPMTAEIYDATGEGELMFDVERGRVHRGTSRVRMPMAMSMTAPDGSEITIDGLVNTTMTMELVER